MGIERYGIWYHKLLISKYYLEIYKKTEKKFSLMKKLSEIFYTYKVYVNGVITFLIRFSICSTAHTRLKAIVFLELDLSSDVQYGP